jgi:hypothetical protein
MVRMRSGLVTIHAGHGRHGLVAKERLSIAVLRSDGRRGDQSGGERGPKEHRKQHTREDALHAHRLVTENRPHSCSQHRTSKASKTTPTANGAGDQAARAAFELQKTSPQDSVDRIQDQPRDAGAISAK